MALIFKRYSTILQEWKNRIAGLIPGVNLTDDSDWVVRGKALSGVVEGAYAEQELILGDVFPLTAREPALNRHGEEWGVERRGATTAKFTALFTGTTSGAPIAPNVILVAGQSQRRYRTVTSGVLSGFPYELSLEIESVETGSLQNLTVGTVLTFEAVPPVGYNLTATVTAVVSNGRAQESLTSWAERIDDYIKNPPAGGNQRDYERYPLEASPDVLKSFIDRHRRGLGTVDVYFTAGTADIDAAVDAGDPVARIPGAPLIATVQEYIEERVPVTDLPLVLAPTEEAVNVTVSIQILDEFLFAEVEPIVEREVERFLYKLIPKRSQALVVKHAELTISLAPLIGTYLADLSVSAIGGATLNKTLSVGALATPGTITIAAL